MTFVHKAGKLHSNVDALSRLLRNEAELMEGRRKEEEAVEEKRDRRSEERDTGGQGERNAHGRDGGAAEKA
jgi:hypothetical protein